MDKLNLFAGKINGIDAKMIALFEQRMSFVKKAAEYKVKHDIKPEKKANNAQIVDKVTSTACDTEVIEYTEGLIMYLYSASKKYQRKIINGKSIKGRH